MPLRPTARSRPRRPRTRSLGWRLLSPLVFALAGALFVTSWVASGGTDLRAGRYDDLDGLANAEAKDLQQLQGRSADLSSEVDRLTQDLGSTATQAAQRRAAALGAPVGLSAVSGAGVTITLDDAPDDVLARAGSDVSLLLVHQQDIQAVANALWAGGAQAMTLQGQRVVATTGIKCVGNTVVLHGVPYSPPYTISAVGPVDRMLRSIDTNPYIGYYLQSVSKGLGWQVRQEPTLDLPGYDGPTDLQYARPVTATASGADTRG